MHDPELLTRDTFAANLHSIFRVVLTPEHSVDIRLVEVSELKTTRRQERFSILFEGPLDSFLNQGAYTMEHEHLGTFDLFIVTIAKEEECFVYEALFNRLV